MILSISISQASKTSGLICHGGYKCRKGTFHNHHSFDIGYIDLLKLLICAHCLIPLHIILLFCFLFFFSNYGLFLKAKEYGEKVIQDVVTAWWIILLYVLVCKCR